MTFGLPNGMCLGWLAALVVLASSTTFADEQAVDQQLVANCDEFEQALLHLDFDTLEHLVLSDATVFYADGGLGRNLAKTLRDKSERKAKNDNWKPASLRVLYRGIAIRDDVAVVNELLGAVSPMADQSKVKPRRRTTLWVNDDLQSKDSASAWRVLSLHESLYSTWEKAITAYEEKDLNSRPGDRGIVFVGSSSIRGWKTLTKDFPGLPVLGRGFGGSQLIDSTMYAHRIVLPYRPQAVAVYAGDNDVAFGKSAQQVFHDFRQLVETIHATDESIHIGFIAIKPSLKRWSLWPKMRDANARIADYMSQETRLTYLDIATPMIAEDGRPKPELFAKDGLHLSPAGYAIWTGVVRPWAESTVAEVQVETGSNR